jgi:hypothetical protein
LGYLAAIPAYKERRRAGCAGRAKRESYGSWPALAVLVLAGASLASEGAPRIPGVLRAPLGTIGIRVRRRIDLEYGIGIGSIATAVILTVLYCLKLPSSAYGDFTQYGMLHTTNVRERALARI